MKNYFGTDGVRANSNSTKLNGITLMKLGMALGKYFTATSAAVVEYVFLGYLSLPTSLNLTLLFCLYSDFKPLK